MNDSARLERGYQRLLTWYPQVFRDKHEEEVLTVLMASARPGQRRPGLAASVDLIRSALGMRLRPGARRPPATVTGAIRLMLMGAVVELGAWITVGVTAGSVNATMVHRDPARASAVLGHISSAEGIAPLGIALWLWLAWAIGQGYNKARVAFTVFFGLTTASLILWLALGAAEYARADLVAVGCLWLVELCALVLIFNKHSAAYYRQEAAKQ